MVKNIISELSLFIKAYMHGRISLQFSKLGKGGSFRGVTWQPFKPWYYRNNGKQAVPLWHGKGKLRSKHKGSKKRYSKSSKLMQNTGTLKSSIVQDVEFTNAGIKLITACKYAKTQNNMRKFNFFTPEEIKTISNKASMLASKLFQGIIK